MCQTRYDVYQVSTQCGVIGFSYPLPQNSLEVTRVRLSILEYRTAFLRQILGNMFNVEMFHLFPINFHVISVHMTRRRKDTIRYSVFRIPDVGSYQGFTAMKESFLNLDDNGRIRHITVNFQRLQDFGIRRDLRFTADPLRHIHPGNQKQDPHFRIANNILH